MEDIFDGLNLNDNELFVGVKPQAKGVPLQKDPSAEQELLEALGINRGSSVFGDEKVNDNIEKKGLRELVMAALKERGGIEYLKELQDKDFVKLLTSSIPAELKVQHEIVPHEDFLRQLAAHPKVTDVNPEDVKVLTEKK